MATTDGQRDDVCVGRGGSDDAHGSARYHGGTGQQDTRTGEGSI